MTQGVQGLVATVMLLAAAAGCLGGDLDRTVGFVCHAAVECDDELSCQYDRCRLPCERDADCPEGRVCIASLDDRINRVCTLPIDHGCVDHEDCRAPRRCGPDGICRETCDVAADCLGDRRCTEGTCLER